MSVVPLYAPPPAEQARRERSRALYRGTSLIITPPLLDPYCRTIPRDLVGS